MHNECQQTSLDSAGDIHYVLVLLLFRTSSQMMVQAAAPQTAEAYQTIH